MGVEDPVGVEGVEGDRWVLRNRREEELWKELGESRENLGTFVVDSSIFMHFLLNLKTQSELRGLVGWALGSGRSDLGEVKNESEICREMASSP